MERLNLPAYDFKTRQAAGKQMIFDPVRRKYVRLTPEEWVRQHFVQFMVQELGYPAALIAVEMAFTYQQMPRRADVVVYDRTGRAVLMVECKKPEIEIQQSTFDQVARYNKVVGARYLVVTNGRVHFAAEIDRAGQTYRFLDELPRFDDL